MLGGGGRLLSRLGLTAKVAQLVGVKLTSELSGELGQFAVPESGAFDNRRELSGCFSREALTALARTLAGVGFSPSAVADGVLAGADIGLRAVASGGGVFGILSPTAGGDRVDLTAMDGARRRRVPRAFLENAIREFDGRMAQAQAHLQREHPDEKIRMGARVGELPVCCTNHFLFVMDPDLRRVVARVPIVDAEIQECTGVEIRLVLSAKGRRGELTLRCEDSEHAEILMAFLRSQKQMIGLFGGSLI
jgi:hypothetical protein